jgi:lipid-A-disaccharide synthase-like uncharacterized protein
MKRGPVIAMIGLLAVAAWLVFGPLSPFGALAPDPGAQQSSIVIASSKCILETSQDPATGEWTFRILGPDGWASEPFNSQAFLRMWGPDIYDRATNSPRSLVLKFFHITSWTNLIWISIGLFGQLTFSGRIIIQWLASEKRGISTVPVIFWWLSLAGGICLFCYFIWRQDFVGILGQAPGVVIYARNLHLIYRPRPVPVPG